MTTALWARRVDELVAGEIPGIQRDRAYEDIYRWTYGARQSQLYCLSDTTAVVLHLRRSEDVAWEPFDVERRAISDEPPETVAAYIVRNIKGAA